MNVLKQHQWKGNIRELKNIIERAMILCSGELLPEHLPFDFTSAPDAKVTFDLAEMEKQHILKVLHYTKQNKTESARLMGIGLTTLYRKLQEYNYDLAQLT